MNVNDVWIEALTLQRSQYRLLPRHNSQPLYLLGIVVLQTLEDPKDPEAIAQLPIRTLSPSEIVHSISYCNQACHLDDKLNIIGPKNRDEKPRDFFYSFVVTPQGFPYQLQKHYRDTPHTLDAMIASSCGYELLKNPTELEILSVTDKESVTKILSSTVHSLSEKRACVSRLAAKEEPLETFPGQYPEGKASEILLKVKTLLSETEKCIETLYRILERHGK
jgi:hypothetical protein